MQQKYQTYDSLSKALSRSTISRQGPVATFLLNTFLENNGHLKASHVYELGLCDEGKFRDWRKKLCDEGWLNFVIKNNKKILYEPGKKLIKYINREKFSSREIVVKRDLDPINEELRELKDKVSVMQNAIDSIIKDKNPPLTRAKQEMFSINPLRALEDRTL